jgi:hypothetical protein
MKLSKSPVDGSTIPNKSGTGAARDANELRRLWRLHYALAVFTALCSLLAIPFVQAGKAAVEASSAGDLDQELAGLVLLATGLSIAVLCLVHAAVLVYIGLLVRSCRRWLLIMIFAGLHSINVPFGTALSIYTFIVLTRESVKQRFFARSAR